MNVDNRIANICGSEEWTTGAIANILHTQNTYGTHNMRKRIATISTKRHLTSTIYICHRLEPKCSMCVFCSCEPFGSQFSATNVVDKSTNCLVFTHSQQNARIFFLSDRRFGFSVYSDKNIQVFRNRIYAICINSHT